MIKQVLIALFCIALCSCTAVALRRSTVTVSSSVETILQEEILGNLGRFYDSPFAIPSQVTLSTGVVTVQNQLTSTLKVPYSLVQKSSKEEDVGANMQWQEAWTITPITDSEDLSRLQYLYSRAVSHVRKNQHAELSFNGTLKYLSFSTEAAGFGKTLEVPCPKPPPSTFEDCDRIDSLLSKSQDWLAFDVKPGISPNEGTEFADDHFVDMKTNAGHHIWARQREFSQFVLYVLYAVPKSKSTADQGKGLSFSIQ